MNMSISLRERIRINLISAMSAANINQVQLAERLGIKKGTVNNWVRGNNSPDVDMVVSVTEARANPYYNCFETDSDGFLHVSKGDGKYIRRQDAPKAWEYNGAIYIINPQSLKRKSLGEFKRRRMYEMDELHSLDLDTPLDWRIAELLIAENEI